MSCQRDETLSAFEGDVDGAVFPPPPNRRPLSDPSTGVWTASLARCRWAASEVSCSIGSPAPFTCSPAEGQRSAPSLPPSLPSSVPSPPPTSPFNHHCPYSAQGAGLCSHCSDSQGGSANQRPRPCPFSLTLLINPVRGGTIPFLEAIKHVFTLFC